MDNYCRACLSQYESSELIQYTEKNRRLFVYSTGLQVKRNDAFIFQLCKECYNNMKAACNFKKNCRNSDKKLKSFLENKEAGENVDFPTYIQNYDDSLKIRLPLNIGNSTPANRRNKDDDNESTCTSIQNFMSDILKEDEIPDNEARIICEVIKEEADILEDSLDSHWLQDDNMSLDSDFRFDASFSPFSTPRPIADANFVPNKFNELCEEKISKENQKSTENNENSINSNKSLLDLLFKKPILKDEVKDNKCVIDYNLENALKNSAEKVMLDEILMTPPVMPSISSPPTPSITKYFNDKIDDIIKDNKNEINEEFHDKIDNIIKDTKYINNREFAGKIEEILKDAKYESNQEFPKKKEEILKDAKYESKQEFPEKIEEILKDAKYESNQEFPEKIEEILKDAKYESNQEFPEKIEEILKDAKYESNQEFYDKIDDIIKDTKYESNQEFPEKIEDILKNTKYESKQEFQNKINKDENVQEDKIALDKFLINSSKEIDDFDDSLMDLEDMQTYFNKQTESKTESPIDGKYCITNFYCKMCDRKFKNLVALKVHLTKNHKIKLAPPKKKYICHYCERGFTTARWMAIHLAKHEKKTKIFQCIKCSLKFTTESRLKMHMTVHSKSTKKTGSEHKIKIKGIVCSICGAMCTSSSNLSIHMRRHDNNYLFKCEECGKGFYRVTDLTIHMRHHTGERPYKCFYCTRSFTRQDILTRHMKLHTDERPYSCQICGASFCKIYDLKLHQIKVKTCLVQQKNIVTENTENIADSVLVTKAFVS